MCDNDTWASYDGAYDADGNILDADNNLRDPYNQEIKCVSS